MAPVLRSARKLRCFYCNRRSKAGYHGQASFDCENCDATNWLDENGDITDPPTTSSASDPIPSVAVQYAVPRGSNSKAMSPPIVDSFRSADSIFCSTCQRNQEHVARTLKEYEIPDDQSDPEYAARLRSYRTWRKDLEDRYPQMCADCAPNVQAQLQKASYTAKTDHLRRMMDRTRAQRQEVKKRSTLDYVDLAGRWTWHAAFAFEFAWHIIIVAALLSTFDFGNGADHWIFIALRKACASGLDVLPDPSRVIRWSINMSLASSPWNPRFKQTIRGFTSHILGFRQWYTYQLVIVLIRCACLFISQYNNTRGIPPSKQLGAHLVISWLMLYVYKVAGKSIRTDNTPLFGTSQPIQVLREEKPTPRSPQASTDLGGILDEILQTPVGVRAGDQSATPPTSSPYHHQAGSLGIRRNHSLENSALSSSRLSGTPSFSRQEPQVTYDADEMDWSPSGSQHRAFSGHNPFKVKNPNPRFNDSPIGFNDTPVEPKSGTFWYKIPPAPTNPAQRLRNPPMKPIIRESPKDKKESIFLPSASQRLDFGAGTRDSDSSIMFRDPQFFAPGPPDDPRDGLSNMMGSFSISPSPDERVSTSRMATGGASLAMQSNSKTRTAELIVLIGALWTWVSAIGSQESYGPTMGLAAICASLLVSIRLSADLLVDAQIRGDKPPSILRPSWANLGMAQVAAAIILVWRIWADSDGGITCGIYGSALMSVMIAHQIWHVFI
ncbi:Ima1 N-terminal domain-containing protein [Xylariales sp. PMI_506]|nr:Ima1 N-terminal domain-containing protein [Xylariales sp. PMI_506]